MGKKDKKTPPIPEVETKPLTKEEFALKRATDLEARQVKELGKFSNKVTTAINTHLNPVKIGKKVATTIKDNVGNLINLARSDIECDLSQSKEEQMDNLLKKESKVTDNPEQDKAKSPLKTISEALGKISSKLHDFTDKYDQQGSKVKALRRFTDTYKVPLAFVGASVVIGVITVTGGGALAVGAIVAGLAGTVGIGMARHNRNLSQRSVLVKEPVLREEQRAISKLSAVEQKIVLNHAKDQVKEKIDALNKSIDSDEKGKKKKHRSNKLKVEAVTIDNGELKIALTPKSQKRLKSEKDAIKTELRSLDFQTILDEAIDQSQQRDALKENASIEKELASTVKQRDKLANAIDKIVSTRTEAANAEKVATQENEADSTQDIDSPDKRSNQQNDKMKLTGRDKLTVLQLNTTQDKVEKLQQKLEANNAKLATFGMEAPKANQASKDISSKKQQQTSQNKPTPPPRNRSATQTVVTNEAPKSKELPTVPDRKAPPVPPRTKAQEEALTLEPTAVQQVNEPIEPTVIQSEALNRAPLRQRVKDVIQNDISSPELTVTQVKSTTAQQQIYEFDQVDESEVEVTETQLEAPDRASFGQRIRNAIENAVQTIASRLRSTKQPTKEKAEEIEPTVAQQVDEHEVKPHEATKVKFLEQNAIETRKITRFSLNAEVTPIKQPDTLTPFTVDIPKDTRKPSPPLKAASYEDALKVLNALAAKAADSIEVRNESKAIEQIDKLEDLNLDAFPELELERDALVNTAMNLVRRENVGHDMMSLLAREETKLILADRRAQHRGEDVNNSRPLSKFNKQAHRERNVILNRLENLALDPQNEPEAYEYREAIIRNSVGEGREVGVQALSEPSHSNSPEQNPTAQVLKPIPKRKAPPIPPQNPLPAAPDTQVPTPPQHSNGEFQGEGKEISSAQLQSMNSDTLKAISEFGSAIRDKMQPEPTGNDIATNAPSNTPKNEAQNAGKER